MKTLFITHKGVHENNTETDVYQDIVHYDNYEPITMDWIFKALSHRYSTFRPNNKITIIDIKSI